MKLRYLRAFIVLLAGLITLIMNIKTHKNVTVSLLILLIVLLIFYVLATLIVEILQRSLEQKQEPVMDAELNLEQTEMEDTEEAEDNQEETSTISFDEDDI